VIALPEGPLLLMDREALAVHTGRSVHTIRAHCAPVRYDDMGRALYDSDRCWTLLEVVPTRRRAAA